MPTSTVEDYIKAIYTETQDHPDTLLPIGQLAAEIKVVPGTATSMVKSLKDAGLVHYEPRVGVRLSRQGEALALHVLRRHRLVELFLVKILKMDWSEIHEEAENLEHVVSERVLEHIDALLNHPQYDPHGDPIPSLNGEMEERQLTKLPQCNAGETRLIGRILDQEPDFLQFAERKGLVPGQEITILSKDTMADAIQIQSPICEKITLGHSVASKIEVE